jgi:hypothetical protein
MVQELGYYYCRKIHQGSVLVHQKETERVPQMVTEPESSQKIQKALDQESRNRTSQNQWSRMLQVQEQGHQMPRGQAHRKEPERVHRMEQEQATQSHLVPEQGLQKDLCLALVPETQSLQNHLQLDYFALYCPDCNPRIEVLQKTYFRIVA